MAVSSTAAIPGKAAPRASEGREGETAGNGRR
jgi:hypothetical protein